MRDTSDARVLVIDDHPDTVQMMRMLLEGAGFEVRAVGDGATALAAFQQFRPHVVLLDIALPKLDGFEVTRRIRREPGAERVFIVMVSGYARDVDKVQSIEAGANFHCAKPADPRVLVELVRNWRNLELTANPPRGPLEKKQRDDKPRQDKPRDERAPGQKALDGKPLDKKPLGDKMLDEGLGWV